jgi:lysine-specific demethylase 3
MFRRQDSHALQQFLTAHTGEFTHQGDTVSPEQHPPVGVSPVQSQMFMLAQRHRDLLREETGVEMWHFEQHPNEAVFIPAGCAHQVRNLQSCCKVRGCLGEPGGTYSWKHQASLSFSPHCEVEN